MFSLFFAGLQQDFKLAIWPPILCALFRLAFILIYREKKDSVRRMEEMDHLLSLRILVGDGL